MAMLSEPRRKQKVINLRAKNNVWSNDNTKFGQRMLEKMGWTSGKGLGANENGITEHVVARYKNDEKGLGFEDKNDQWTKHEDDFNNLLANLSNASNNTENLHSGISLEDKSKKSRARIHYHKFTRGKDISRYSEKDLANIFGKKSFKNTEEAQELVKEDAKTTEQIFTEKGSMEEYFKNKLAEIKSKGRIKDSPVKENDEYGESSYGFCGFSQKTDNKECGDGHEYTEDIKDNNENARMNVECDSVMSKKKKKKSKMHDDLSLSQNDNANTNYNTHNQSQESLKEKDHKKKSKNKIQNVNNAGMVSNIAEYSDGKIKKKKSKNKQHIINNSGEEQTHDYSSCHEIVMQVTDIEQNCKKKKTKKHNNDSIQNIQNDNLIISQDQAETSHKSSKNKELCEDNNIPQLKKKCKRIKDPYVTQEDVTECSTLLANSPTKKKKRKYKENE